MNDDTVINESTAATLSRPPAIVARLNREFTNIVATPDVKARFAQLGIEPAAMSPEESARRIRAELDKWNNVIREANIKMELAAQPEHIYV